MYKKNSLLRIPEAGMAALPHESIIQYKKKMTLATGLSLLFLLLFSSCSDQEAYVADDTKGIIVSTGFAAAKTYTPELRLTGTVFANREANLGAGFPGRIEKIYYAEGSSVREGQLLVTMGGEMLARSQAEYLALKKDYERVSRLVKQGSVSRQEYDHVKARYDASVAKHELALKNTQIRAPFSGVIVDYMANEGENYFMNFNIEPGYSSTSGILRLMDIDQIKVVTEVNEKDLAHVSTGLKAFVEVDALPGEVFTGEVSLIKPYLSTRSRTASVEITIPNHDRRLKPGMFARVTLQLPEKTEVFVPVEAIYRDPETDREVVFVVADGLVNVRNVQRLNTRGSMHVLSGIENGDEVIMGGKNRVQHGDTVIIVSQNTAQ